MKRRILSIALSLALCVGLLPAAARAETGDGYTEVSAWSDFVSQAKTEGAKIRLTADISGANTIRVESGVTIDGGGYTVSWTTNKTPGFEIKSAPASPATIKDMVIDAAKLSGSNNAMRLYDGTYKLLMENVTIKNSNASGFASGLYIGAGSAVKMKACQFIGNKYAPAVTTAGTLIMDGCLVSGNTKSDANIGCGVRVTGGNLYANNCVFYNNAISGGKGGDAIGISGGAVYLMNSTVTGNHETSSSGNHGAIALSAGSLSAVNCVLVSNTNYGGVNLDVGANAPATLKHCLYTNAGGSSLTADATNTSGVTAAAVFASGDDPSTWVVKAGSDAAAKGVATYFSCSDDASALWMGYGAENTQLAKLGSPTDAQKETRVATYYGGTERSADGSGKYVVGAVGMAAVYDVTCSPAANGTVTATPAAAREGASVTLTAAPDLGYTLQTLTVMGASGAVSVSDNQFTMPATDVTVTATFKEATGSTDTLKFVGAPEELTAALNNAKVTGIIVTADITVDEQLTVPNGVTIGGKKGSYTNGVYPTISVPVPYVPEGTGVPSATAAGASRYGVFTVDNGSTVTLKNMTVMGGDTYTGGFYRYPTGAIVNQGTLLMENVAVTRSSPGLKNIGSTAKAVLKNCSFYRNKAENNGAAGITNDYYATLVLDGCSFRLNSKYSNNYLESAICLLDYAPQGGGTGDTTKYADSKNALYANNCVFLDNDGSAICAEDAVFAYLTNCTTAGNGTAVSYCGSGQTINAVNCLFAEGVGFQKTGVTLENCKTGNELLVSAAERTLKPDTNGCGFYAPVAIGGDAASGGVETYFDYADDGSMVYMSYEGAASPLVSIGTGADTGKRVTTYYEGDERADGVIGASGTPLPAQEISAADVTCTYGDTDVQIAAVVTTPASGGGALRYAVTGGSDVVSVDADGRLTVLKAGSATVTVTAEAADGYRSGTKDVSVTVSKADVSLSYADTAVTKHVGDAVFINPLTNPSGVAVTYASSDTEVAAVDGNGEVTARGVGSASITATYAGDDNHNERSASYALTVSPVAVTGVTLSKSETTLVIDGTETLTANVLPSNATNQNVTWSSSDEAVATVDSDGLVTALAEGTAILTATTEDGGETATCTVTVDTKAMVVSAENAEAAYDGEAHGVTVSVTTPESGYTVTYGTAADDCTLDASPTRSDAGALTVYYRVTAEDYTAVSGSATVTVTPKPITVTADAQEKTYGEANPDLTYTADGLVGEDTLSGAPACAATEASDAGTYDITRGTLANPNYTVTFTGAVLTVNKAERSAPSIGAVSANGVASLAAVPDGAAVQYALLTAAGTPEEDDWQNAAADGENRFAVTGLRASTAYCLYARYAADKNHNASPASEGVSFTTPAGYTVTFDPNGGSVADTDRLTDEDGRLPSLPTPTREGGYRFDGWFTAASGGEPITASTVFTEDITVYAHWAYITSSSSSSPSATTATVTAANGVSLRVSVSGKTAALGALSAKQTEALVASGEESGVVELDMSGLKTAVSTLAIPTDTVKAVEAAADDESQGAASLRVKLADGGVTFDAAALRSIAAQASGRDLRLSLSSVGLSGLNAAQRRALAEMDVQAVYDVSLKSGGKAISDFAGGSAAVDVACARANGQSAAVWYIADDGARERVPAMWRDAALSFSVGHFSRYAIVLDKAPALSKGYATCAKDGTCPVSVFTDIRSAAWYHDGVHFCVENGLMDGASATAFRPDGAATRAAVVEMLWRLEGRPDAPAAAEGAPHSDAVRWAASVGILIGDSTANLAPERAVTREQLAVMLYRCAQRHGGGFTGAWLFPLDFPDAPKVSAWADEAMHWVVKSGVVNGKGRRLAPTATATRAEAATMLMRFAESLEDMED